MHIRCPHCQHPVEIVDGAGLENVDCPSCGSHFSLLSERVAGQDSGPVRNIGHFELIERLGMGQFGTVWLARDTQLDRSVAVKIPRQELIGPGDAELFLREARAAAQLHHPNIVSVHEVGREGDTLYIVSDLVRGATLAERVAAGRLAPREAASLCATICEALHHAHESGVIHRDLKPSNIMLDDEGQPHLMDFGLAKRSAAEITMTLEGKILGTPAYMSPEQAQGESHRADARSDVYSLGTILFELLTGELPFRGGVRMLLLQIIHDEPPSPRKLDSAAPRDLETICMKCLEKSPERRYATAREVADELRRYLAGKPILARPIGRPARAWRWCRRNPVVAGLTSAVAAALLAGAGMSAYLAHEAERRANDALVAKRSANEQAIQAIHEEQRADTARKEAERSLYISQIGLADRDIRAGNHQQARRTLDRCPPELRQWEWYYLNRLQHLDLQTFLPDGGYLHALSFNSDGTELLSVASSDEVIGWNVASGARRRVFSRPGSSAAAFGLAGDIMVSLDPEGAWSLWGTRLGEKRATCPDAPRSFAHLEVSGDGRFVACWQLGHKVRLWDFSAAKELPPFEEHQAMIVCAAFAPDGQRIASADIESSVRIWNVATREVLCEIQAPKLGVLAVAFSPDGRGLVTAGGDGALRIWNAERGHELSVFRGHHDAALCITFSADGRQIASGGLDKTVRIWNAATGARTDTFTGHYSLVRRVVFHPNGTHLASMSDDETIKLWPIGGHPRPLPQNEDGPAKFDPQTVGPAGVANVMTTAKAACDPAMIVATDLGRVEDVAFLSDGGHVVAAGGSGCIATVLRRLLVGQLMREMKQRSYGTIALCDTTIGGLGATTVTQSEQPHRIALTPDGTQLALAAGDNRIVVREVATGRELFTDRGRDFIVPNVAFSPDGKRIAVTVHQPHRGSGGADRGSAG